MSDPRRATIRAYQADARTYAAGAPVPDRVADAMDAFVAGLPDGGHVLEIGSGPGRDARELERRGLTVRRSDITPAFVDLMRADGHDADVLDPLTDDLGGPYDGVWASAVLLHVAREDLGTVLRRLHDATVVRGTLSLSLKEGDGEAWSTHGHIAAPRHFVYWREESLRTQLEASGWRVATVRHTQGVRDPWLDVLAERT